MVLQSSVRNHSLAIVFLACLFAADSACGALVWSQEFNGTSIDSSVWTYDVGGGALATVSFNITPPAGKTPTWRTATWLSKPVAKIITANRSHPPA